MSVPWIDFDARLRRHAVLRFLSGFPQNRGNDDVVQMALIDDGFPAAHDDVITDFQVLKGAGLITLETKGTYTVAELTRRGADVAAGRLTVDGVRPPLPGRR